jgi:endonuclease G, mitochondrial
MNRTWLHGGWVLLLIIVGVVWLVMNQPGPPPPTLPGGQEPDSYVHLRWGNPSGAKEDPADRDNYLMKKPYFALSYNDAKGTPNWVSWRVAKEDLGETPRNNQPFRPDPDLPAGFKKVLPSDYTGSGFDRGHMCPFGDRNGSEDAGSATFVMTNAVPQSPANNRQAWERFESYCRSIVSRHGKELYIVAGPQGQGGAGEKGPAETLRGQNGPVTVPAKTWKVVMVLDVGSQPDRDARLMAVVMPNDQTVGVDWTPYRTSVRAVEQLTGYTFFDRADPAVIGPLKEKKDEAQPSNER